jgi:hypothetical protein
MLRTPLSWIVVFALLVAGFGATVLALNNDVYSAHGFVRSYLQALERKDADEALAFAGVVVPESEAATLLVDEALGGVGDIRLLSEVADGDEHVVRFAYAIDGAEEITEFRVRPTGTTFGLFSTWAFASSPLARLDVSVVGDSRFTANGVDAPAGTPLLVLAPGAYAVDRDTELLDTAGVTVAVTAIGDTESVDIFATPTSAFTAEATDAVAAFLDTCATQQVLKPTGCPFGYSEANRIEGVPRWSVESYPQVTLAAADASATWRATGTGGAVALEVTVKSVFDGSVRRVDESQPIAGSYLLAIGDDDTVIVLEATALP